MSLTVELAIAKTNKYATRESGDTAEVVERPGGGLSVVLVDGQGSGAPAKLLSNAVASKAVALIKEGARDGAVARATHDYLHHYRGGQVSATLEIISVDLASQTIVLSRNSHCPLLVRDEHGVRAITTDAEPIGPRRHVRPHVQQLPLAAGTQVVLVTDGIIGAGSRRGVPFDPLDYLSHQTDLTSSAAALADGLLAAALAADDGRPGDDMTVVALTVAAGEVAPPLIRRLAVTFPLDSLNGRHR